MDFQIHTYPATASRVDLVVVADFPDQEAEAIEDAAAWGRVCIRSLSAFRAFFCDFTRRNLTFRNFVKPGVMFENFDPSYAESFYEKFKSKFALEAYNNLLPILTAYRRKTHRDHERQRDDFMQLTEPLQIPHYPQVNIIAHEQRYLPGR